MLGLGTMVYLIARKAPQIGDDIIDQPKSKFDYLFASLRLEKIDPILHNFLEKLLRKMKLFLMKLDNIANSYLEKVKKYKINDNGKNGEEKPSLFEQGVDGDKNEN
jgi:hypothetical protein